MIGYIEGRLLKIEEERILLLANQVGYEVLVPAFVRETLNSKQVGDEIALYIYYHQTDRQPKPVLIGFNLEAEKEFFQLFISVEAIGPLKAVKALSVSVRDIANAIETGDLGRLKQLKGIGARTAQKIIATLQGRASKFALIRKKRSGCDPSIRRYRSTRPRCARQPTGTQASRCQAHDCGRIWPQRPDRYPGGAF
jgi:Holliday junction DNA helicase RuvA